MNIANSAAQGTTLVHAEDIDFTTFTNMAHNIFHSPWGWGICKIEKDKFVAVSSSYTCRESYNSIAYPLILNRDIEKHYMAVAMRRTYASKFAKNLHILENLEKELGISSSIQMFDHELKRDSKKYTLVIIDLDPYWKQSILTFNIFTLIFRDLMFIRLNKSYTFEDLLGGKCSYVTTAPYIRIDSIEGIGDWFNLLELLRNINKILGDNPITGYNDKAFLSIKNEGEVIPFPYPEICKDFALRWESIHAYHRGFGNQIGVHSFAWKIDSLINGRNYYNKMVDISYAALWVVNYINTFKLPIRSIYYKANEKK